MNVISQQHVCSTCAYHKVDVKTESPVNEEDTNVFERIQTMWNNAEQAIRPDSIPEDTPKSIAAAYFEGALANKDKADLLIQNWWKEMRKKYNLPENVKFDNARGVFYECIDASGNSNPDGQWVGK